MVFKMTLSEQSKTLEKVALCQLAVDLGKGKVLGANHHAQMGC